MNSINKKVIEILDDLNLRYKTSYLDSETKTKQYFELSFQDINKDRKFNLFVLYLEDLNSLSFLVPDLMLIAKDLIDEEFYKTVNSLNTSTVYGNIFFTPSERKIAINYSHTLILDRGGDFISIEEFSEVLDYINYFSNDIKETFLHQGFQNA